MLFFLTSQPLLADPAGTQLGPQNVGLNDTKSVIFWTIWHTVTASTKLSRKVDRDDD